MASLFSIKIHILFKLSPPVSEGYRHGNHADCCWHVHRCDEAAPQQKRQGKLPAVVVEEAQKALHDAGLTRAIAAAAAVFVLHTGEDLH